MIYNHFIFWYNLFIISEVRTMSKLTQEKIEVLFSKIIFSSNDFIVRAGKPDGKNNRKLVKAYYRKLGQDLLNDVMEISKDLEEIAQ